MNNEEIGTKFSLSCMYCTIENTTDATDKVPMGPAALRLFQGLKAVTPKLLTLLEHAQWHLDRALSLNFQWLNPVGFQKREPMELLNGPWTCSPHRDVALGCDWLILFQSTQQAP
jgi:hypothetical protein